MTTLKDKLSRLIEIQGPISISQFMSACLTDPEYGYYLHQEPFGERGDFTTAPEISQMFGEMLGAWATAQWQAHGAPSAFVFCEMGPGRGTLMDDMVRTIGKLCPSFLEAAHIILIETSRKLRGRIAAKLSPHKLDVTFADRFEELPQLPLILIGNEFLDCLPIHQYYHTSNGYVERMVGLDETGNLCFINGVVRLEVGVLPKNAFHTPLGTIVEISPAREACVEMIAHHLKTQGGSAIFIDYGSLEFGFGDTLQALSSHQFRSSLEAPGRHDLTSHVDFSALERVAQSLGCNTVMTTQGAFLSSLGIHIRAEKLASGHAHGVQQKISRDVERLISDQAMGKLFKVLIING